MASNLCNVSFTWDLDKIASSVTKFAYLDQPIHTSETAATDRLLADINLHSEAVWLTQNGADEENKNCRLQLTCPDPEFAQVNGFVVISESRTLEVSNHEKGYLTTVRGKKLDLEGQSDVTQGNSHDGCATPKLFICSCYFEDSYPSLTLKFLSLGDRASFCVKAVEINIIQHGIKSSVHKSSLDVSKLKKDISDMGSVMSDRAQDFMATLEQYEKNKANGMNGLLSPAFAPSPAVVGLPTGLSNMMSSILGTGTMKSLASLNPGSNGDTDIYSILNSVCGTVSSRRMSSKKHAEKQSETEAEETSCEDSSKLVSKNNQTASVDLAQLKADLRNEMSEMRQEMLTKIEEAKSEINLKLNTILALLQNGSLVNGDAS